MNFSFLQGKMCLPKKSGEPQKFCTSDRHRARNLSRPGYGTGLHLPAMSVMCFTTTSGYFHEANTDCKRFYKYFVHTKLRVFIWSHEAM